MGYSPFLAALLATGLALVPVGVRAEPWRFRLSPEESEIVTEIAHFFGSVKGKLKLREGEAAADPKDLAGTARVELTIKAASYDSGLELRDADVRKNYLEAGRYPAIRFSSGRVEKIEVLNTVPPTWNFTVVGHLELHGVKKEVRVPVKAALREKKIVAEGSVNILLRDYRIPIPSFLFFRSGDSVEARFRFVGVELP